eukprot:761654-Hanusia_phi.AAC.4
MTSSLCAASSCDHPLAGTHAAFLRPGSAPPHEVLRGVTPRAGSSSRRPAQSLRGLEVRVVRSVDPGAELLVQGIIPGSGWRGRPRGHNFRAMAESATPATRWRTW